MKLPKRLFIVVEGEREEEYLMPYQKAEDAVGIEGGKVGVYELKEMQEVSWDCKIKLIK